MSRVRIIIFVALLLVLAPALASRQALAASDTLYWKAYTVGSVACLAAFQLPNGSWAVYASPPFLIVNYLLFRSPYPPGTFCVPVYTNYSYPELAVYYDGTLYVFDGLTLAGTYYLGQGQPYEDYSLSAIAVGRKVFFNGTVYTAPVDDYVPFVANQNLYIIYVNGSAVYVYDATTNTTIETGPSFNITNLDGAFLDPFMDTVVLLANASTLSGPATVYEVFGPFARTAYVVYNITFSRVITYDVVYTGLYTYTVYFYALSGNTLYLVGPNGVLPVATGQFLYYNGSLIFMYNPKTKTIFAVSTSDHSTVLAIKPPGGTAPQLFTAWGGIYAVYSGGTLYLSYEAPQISVQFNGPTQVYVDVPFSYSVQVTGATNYTVLLDGEPVPSYGTLRIAIPGVHVFTIYASNGVATVSQEYNVDVLPRPLVVQLKFLTPPYAFSTAEAELMTYDSLTGSNVSTTCTVTAGGRTLTVMSWEPFNVTLMPLNLTEPYTTINVSCGDNFEYQLTSVPFNVSLLGARPTPRLDYLGFGDIEIMFTGPGGIELNGTAYVYLNGTFYGEGPVPFSVSLPGPGKYYMDVDFTPSVQTFGNYSFDFVVMYYYNLSQAPTTESVTVANLLGRVVTNTTIITRMVTVPQIVQTVDPGELVLVATGALVVGLAAGAMILGGRGEEKEEEEEGGSSGVVVE